MMMTKQETNKSRVLIGAFVICTVILAIIFAILSDFSEKHIFPNKNSNYITRAYSDQDEGGKSFVDLQINDSAVAFTYELDSVFEHPYTGIYWQDSIEENFIDISDYDYIGITVRADKGTQVPLIINAFENGFTVKGDEQSYRPYHYNLQTVKFFKEFLIPLNELETPTWWVKDKGVKIGKQDLSHVRSINIERCDIIKPFIKDNVVIKEIYFKKSNTTLLYCIIISFTIILIAFIMLLITSKKEKKVYIPLQQQEVKTYEEEKNEDAQSIVQFIAENYSNPDLGLRIISENTEIQEINISKVIKSKFDLSFKEYLNLVRLTEAKRLLKESDLNVSEIAYTVGYGNVSHFNRVFKKSEGVSPNQFRSNI